VKYLTWPAAQTITNNSHLSLPCLVDKLMMTTNGTVRSCQIKNYISINKPTGLKVQSMVGMDLTAERAITLNSKTLKKIVATSETDF
jgi:hypothetical protein